MKVWGQQRRRPVAAHGRPRADRPLAWRGDAPVRPVDRRDARRLGRRRRHRGERVPAKSHFNLVGTSLVLAVAFLGRRDPGGRRTRDPHARLRRRRVSHDARRRRRHHARPMLPSRAEAARASLPRSSRATPFDRSQGDGRHDNCARQAVTPQQPDRGTRATTSKTPTSRRADDGDRPQGQEAEGQEIEPSDPIAAPDIVDQDDVVEVATSSRRSADEIETATSAAAEAAAEP